jgi:hypothetical protein
MDVELRLSARTVLVEIGERNDLNFFRLLIERTVYRVQSMLTD